MTKNYAFIVSEFITREYNESTKCSRNPVLNISNEIFQSVEYLYTFSMLTVGQANSK